MSLRDFCQSLQQCAEKLEQEVKCNINEAHNLFFAKAMDETRLAVEKAKDYHYEEIVKALNQILENVKSLISHQDKIEWLNNEANFSSTDLKQYKKVPTRTEQKPSFSRSVENIPQSTKRDRRKTVSEVSAQTLEAWEKYLDQKESNESEVLEIATKTEKTVPRRTLSNARARKKFVSSTMGAFLDDNGRPAGSLESIIERSQNDEEIHNANYSEEHESAINQQTDHTDPWEPSLQSNLAPKPREITSLSSTSPYTKGGICDTLNLVDKTKESSIQKEEIIIEFMKDFGDNGDEEIGPRQEDPIKLKPKIVDVIVS